MLSYSFNSLSPVHSCSYFFLTQLSLLCLLTHRLLQRSESDLISLWPQPSEEVMSSSSPFNAHTETHTRKKRNLSKPWQLSEHLTNPLGLFNLWPLPLVNMQAAVNRDAQYLEQWQVLVIFKMQHLELKVKTERKCQFKYPKDQTFPGCLNLMWAVRVFGSRWLEVCFLCLIWCLWFLAVMNV